MRNVLFALVVTLAACGSKKAADTGGGSGSDMAGSGSSMMAGSGSSMMAGSGSGSGSAMAAGSGSDMGAGSAMAAGSGSGSAMAAGSDAGSGSAAAGSGSAAAGSGSAAAGSGSGSGSSAMDAVPAGTTPFDKLEHEAKHDLMKKVVTPAMRTAFHDFDPKKYEKVGCKTCHGKDPEKSHFKMPNPDLPQLDFAALKAGKQKPEVAKFMGEVVTPMMAKILDLPEYTEKNPTGFGCLGCHTQKK
jgi:hypothetical protein